jgi:transposase InsO family protein
MRAARDCAKQLLLPAAAGISGGTRASEAARPDFHRPSGLRQPPVGLWAVRPKRNTSKRHPEHKVYPYLLRGKTIDQPNQVWAADVTYIPMQQGFLYLVAIIDWATRRVLSWGLSNTLTAGFCVEALSEALARFGEPGISRSSPCRTPRVRDRSRSNRSPPPR